MEIKILVSSNYQSKDLKRVFLKLKILRMLSCISAREACHYQIVIGITSANLTRLLLFHQNKIKIKKQFSLLIQE